MQRSVQNRQTCSSFSVREKGPTETRLQYLRVLSQFQDVIQVFLALEDLPFKLLNSSNGDICVDKIRHVFAKKPHVSHVTDTSEAMVCCSFGARTDFSVVWTSRPNRRPHLAPPEHFRLLLLFRVGSHHSTFQNHHFCLTVQLIYNELGHTQIHFT